MKLLDNQISCSPTIVDSSSPNPYKNSSSIHFFPTTIFYSVHSLPSSYIHNHQMAHWKTRFAFAVVLVAILWTGSTAQTTDCTNALITLSPCLNYITGNSSKPDSGCCTQLSSVVKSKPECLCQVLNGGGSSFGIQINQTQAQALPGICNVKTPPLSTCNSMHILLKQFVPTT